MTRIVPARAFAVIMVLLGIGAAVIMGVHRKRANDVLVEGALQRVADDAATELTSKLRLYEYGVRGVRAAIIGGGGESLSRERFEAYIRSRDLPKEFPGAHGFGFVRRVPRDQEPAFVENVRRRGFPDFAIHALGEHTGERFVIELVEPYAQNAEAVGLDVGSEPRRRAGALRAMYTGHMTITAPIELLQLPSDARTGFLIFLPLLRDGSPPRSAAEREAATIGWAYAVVSLKKVLASSKLGHDEYTLALSDVSDPAAPIPMLRAPEHPADALLVRRSLSMFGRTWQAELAPGPQFLANLRLDSALAEAGIVLAVALLLALATYLYLSRLEHARKDSERQQRELEERVVARTEELRLANERLGILAVQLQTAQRITNVGSWEFDVATQHVDWSDELFRVFAVDPAEGVPDSAGQAALFSEETWARLTAATQHSIVTGESYEVDATVIRRDGERRIAVARAEALRGASGQVTRVVGTLQDVTARERTATQLRIVSERLKLATSAAQIGVWELDLVTGESFWDETMYRMYGRSVGYDHGRHVIPNLVHPSDVEAVERAHDAARLGSSPFDVKFRAVRPDGEIRYMHAEGTVHRDDAGKPARIVGVNRDITDAHLMESALRSSETTLRTMLAHAGSAIISSNRDGVVTLFNRASEELLGYSASEIIQQTTPVIFHDMREVEAQRAAMELERGVPITIPDVFTLECHEGRTSVREWTYVRKDGSRVPVLLTLTAMRDAQGTVFGYLGVVADLTAQKEHQRALVELNELLAQRTEQAESASRAKSMFLANMSHEIRTPIGAITGLTYLLSRTQLTVEQQNLLNTIERSTKTLLSMVNDVLDLSKIEAQQLVLESSPFALGELLSDLSSFMSAYATGKQLELIVDASDVNTAQVLLGDRIRLMQVLTNLVGNAIKYTDQGSVRVLVQQQPSGDAAPALLRFEVQDTGAGIAPDFLPRLFSAFTQAEQRGTRRREGTGLGLAIVKQLVTMMGGEVGADSVLDAGSRFWVSIPFARASRDVRAKREFTELRVLVVDDHDAQRAALASCAKQLGWTVQVAADGRRALTMVLSQAHAAQRIDVIILDWQMPSMDGLQTLRMMREALAAEHCAQPCVVVTTVHELGDLRAQTESAGADALLAKPVTASELFDAVLRGIAARGTGGAPSMVPPSTAGQRLPGVTLLVADDSDINRDIARCILELEGAHVRLANDGAEAVEMVRAGNGEIDLVLMDVQMPVEDGVSATERIRADPRFAKLPILAVTAGALAAERERALAAGMNDFVTKPYDPEQLIGRVREHVSAVRGTPVGITSHLRATSSTLSWPEIEGIDADVAHARLGGDGPLFRRLLGRLLEELEHARQSEVLSLAPAHDGALSAWLHKLRGMAGNVGAGELESRARTLEAALLTSERARCEDARAQLLEELDRVRTSVRAQLLGSNWLTPASVNDNASLDRATLERLLVHLREQDFDALTLVAQLGPLLASQLGAERAATLGEALERLDFAAAEALVAQLMPTGT